jgi:hypothetical protein
MNYFQVAQPGLSYFANVIKCAMLTLYKYFAKMLERVYRP